MEQADVLTGAASSQLTMSETPKVVLGKPQRLPLGAYSIFISKF